MEREGYLIVYPEYFDYRLSRKLGRKLALKYCIKNPTLEEIAESARKLKLPIVIEEDKYHPANWFERKGRIKVYMPNKKYKKLVVLKAIAKNLRDVRKKLMQKKMIETKKAKRGKPKDIDKFIKRALKNKRKKQ